MKVANKRARTYVKTLTPFKGSNTFAEWRAANPDARRYIVYSYGYHWPLFIWENGVWYENEDKYSVSTSKHASQLHPHAETRKVSAADMDGIAYMGATKHFIGRGDHYNTAGGREYR